MRRSVKLALLAAVLAGLLPAAGCGRLRGGAKAAAADPNAGDSLLPDKGARAKGNGPATPEQDALLRVLDENRGQFKAGFGQLGPDAKPSAVTKVLGKYSEQLEKTDLSGCPAEFKAVHGRHAQAWRKLHAALSRLPDVYEGTEFMTALRSLFADNPAKGESLGGDVVKGVAKVNSTFAQMYTAAEGYGIEVDGK